MRIDETDGPSPIRGLWPDMRDEPPGSKPRLSDEERERALREKWGNPQHSRTTVQSGDARRRNADGSKWPKRQKFDAPTPMEGNQSEAIANPVSFFGPASRGIPLNWGSGMGATDVREHGARPHEVVLRDPLVKRLPSGEVVVEPGKGEIRRNEDGTPQTLVTRLDGGGARNGKGRIEFTASDKLPCYGTGMRAEIVHTVETREGQRGPYNVDVYRSACPGCKIVRDVPKKIAEATNPRTTWWEYPHHAQPKGAVTSGFQDHGAIMALTYEHHDRAGDRIIATVERPDPDQQVQWMPAPACPEIHYGMAVNLALGEAEYSDRDKTRGMRRHAALVRAAAQDNVALHLPLYLAHENGRTVEKRGVWASAPPRATKVKEGEKSRPAANGRVDLPASDLEIYRRRREERPKVAATPMILCNAEKAPPRAGILAF